MSDTERPAKLDLLQKKISARFEEDLRAAQRLLMSHARATLDVLTSEHPSEAAAAEAFILNQVQKLDSLTMSFVTVMMTQAFLISLTALNDAGIPDTTLDTVAAEIDAERGAKS